MVDEKLDDQVWVTVVATGYGDEGRRKSVAASRSRPRASCGCSAPRRRARRSRAGLDELEVPEFIPASDAASTAPARPVPSEIEIAVGQHVLRAVR